MGQLAGHVLYYQLLWKYPLLARIQPILVLVIAPINKQGFLRNSSPATPTSKYVGFRDLHGRPFFCGDAINFNSFLACFDYWSIHGYWDFRPTVTAFVFQLDLTTSDVNFLDRFFSLDTVLHTGTISTQYIQKISVLAKGMTASRLHFGEILLETFAPLSLERVLTQFIWFDLDPPDLQNPSRDKYISLWEHDWGMEWRDHKVI